MDGLRKVALLTKASGTIECHATAVSKFYSFLKEYNIPLPVITGLPRSYLDWDESTTEKMRAICMLYLDRVQRSHSKATTCRTYAAQVVKFWKLKYNQDLFPDHFFKESVADYTKALALVKMHTLKYREGLDGSDVVVLSKVIRDWAVNGLKISPRSKFVWNAALASNVTASFLFSYGLWMRYGEATCPGGSEFKADIRLTRASVSIVKNSTPGGRDIMHVKPGRYKVMNKHAGRELSGEINYKDPLNWPVAILKLIREDPVAPHEDSYTPLFRDTRGLCKGPSGCFPGLDKAKPLPQSFALKCLRLAITRAPDWFGARDPLNFGLHSFRIGRMNDYLDAGADYFVCAEEGRWTSQSILDYHRLSRRAHFKWNDDVNSNALKRLGK